MTLIYLSPVLLLLCEVTDLFLDIRPRTHTWNFSYLRISRKLYPTITTSGNRFVKKKKLWCHPISSHPTLSVIDFFFFNNISCTSKNLSWAQRGNPPISTLLPGPEYHLLGVMITKYLKSMHLVKEFLIKLAGFGLESLIVKLPKRTSVLLDLGEYS